MLEYENAYGRFLRHKFFHYLLFRQQICLNVFGEYAGALRWVSLLLVKRNRKLTWGYICMGCGYCKLQRWSAGLGQPRYSHFTPGKGSDQ